MNKLFVEHFVQTENIFSARTKDKRLVIHHQIKSENSNLVKQIHTHTHKIANFCAQKMKQIEINDKAIATFGIQYH